MNCSQVRQHLLSSDRPDQPAAAVAAHLAGCPACRAYRHRLVRLEQDLPRLAVPPSRPPVQLLEQILRAPAGKQIVIPPASLHANPDATRAGGRQKLALAFALAAALAVFAVGWWAWPRLDFPAQRPTRTDPYLAALDNKLKDARTPQERVVRLADLADDFMKEARDSRDDVRHLNELAGRFDRLGGDLHRCALQVPRAERRKVLGEVSERLRTIDSEASRLEAWAEREQRPHSAQVYRRIARSVRATRGQLDELVREAVRT